MQTHVGISLLGKPLAQGQKPEQQFLLSASSASSSPASEGSGGGGGGGKGEPQDAVQVFMGALLFSAVASFIGGLVARRGACDASQVLHSSIAAVAALAACWGCAA